MASDDLTTQIQIEKIVVVVVIVLNLIANAFVLRKIVRAAGGFLAISTGPRCIRLQTLVSLVIGDVFLALFSLVVLAIVVYDDVRHVTCRTYTLSTFYMKYISPFVYGVGLVVLAAECIWFRRRALPSSVPSPATTTTSPTPNIMICMAVSASPWILGILVALPITVYGLNFDTCRIFLHPGRRLMIICVCQIAPAMLALILAFWNICSKEFNTVEPLVHFANQQVPGVVRGQPTWENARPGTGSTQQPFPPQDHLAVSYQRGGQPMGEKQQNVVIPIEPVAQYGGEAPNQYGAFPTPGFNTQPQGDGSAVDLVQLDRLSSYYSLRERITLVVVAIVFCLCVLPSVAFTFVRLSALTDDIAFWLLAARTVLVPFFWGVLGSIERPSSMILRFRQIGLWNFRLAF